MASRPDSQDHKKPEKEDGQATSDSNQAPPPAPGHPQTMGYPPSMVYPQGQPGYNGYANNNGYNYNYPCAQAPPAAHHMHPQQQQQQGLSRWISKGFARGFLIGIITLVLFMCTSTILLWMILRPEFPVFKVNNLSVTNFVASQNDFVATWDANVTAANHNTKLRAYFNQIETFMFYDGESVLAQSFAQPFFLETKTNVGMQVKLSANNSENSQVPNLVVDDMAHDREMGSITFSLRMAIWSTFKSGRWYKRETTLKVYCEDLKVIFEGNTGNGNLAIDNKDSECIVVG